MGMVGGQYRRLLGELLEILQCHLAQPVQAGIAGAKNAGCCLV